MKEAYLEKFEDLKEKSESESDSSSLSDYSESEDEISSHPLSLLRRMVERRRRLRMLDG